jgi:hypothetical protein
LHGFLLCVNWGGLDRNIRKGIRSPKGEAQAEACGSMSSAEGLLDELLTKIVMPGREFSRRAICFVY